MFFRIFLFLNLFCISNATIFKNTFNPFAKYEFIKPPFQDTVYDSHYMVSKTVNTMKDGVDNIDQTLKSASYKLFLTSEKVHEIENKLSNLNENIQEYVKNKEEFLDNMNHQIGYTTVKIISSILPHVDTIGHKVLHMDDEIINYFINMPDLSPEWKKSIILYIIHISQEGDHFGAQMLQLYYDIVDKLM